MIELKQVVADLDAEGDQLDAVLAGLGPDQWALPTPAPGWTVAHQVAHLTATFRMAGMAAGEPAAFTAMVSRLSDDFDANVKVALSMYLTDPAAMLERWQAERTAASEALLQAPPDKPVPWLVNPLPPHILASAGMMELFAHGQDIADAVGTVIERTDRIRHLTAFAVRNRDFGYLMRGQAPSTVEMRFELVAPSGERWDFGPEDAADRISGPAKDFCLLVTRRRHRADLALRISGAEADRWADVAQAYRGSPGPGREPGQFAGRGA
ncbi:MAG: TIGR03084 family metal-binding protein [Frankiaceae bacterium]